MKLPRLNRFSLGSKSIRKEIFALFLGVVTVPFVLISVITYWISVDAVKKEFQNSSELILNNLSFNIDQYLRGIENATLFAYMDQRLQNTLESFIEQPRDFQTLAYQQVINNFISSLESTIKNVHSVQLFTSTQTFYAGTGGYDIVGADYDYRYQDSDWYKATLASSTERKLFGTHKPFQRKYSNDLVISFSRVINKVNTGKQLGVLLIDIRLDSIREILELSENNKRNFIIIDPEGNTIYASRSDQVKLMSKLNMKPESMQQILSTQKGNLHTSFAEEKVFVNYMTSNYSGWKVIQYVNERDMIQESLLLGRMFLILAICSTGVAMLFMFFISVRVSQPIIDLSKKMKLLGQGNFNVQLDSKRQDELGFLYRGLRKMIDDLKSYIDRATTAKAKQKEAQFSALKSQINPHFLANTLETIQMQAIINNQRHLGEMIGVLGKLFKIHTQTGKELVPLHRELEHIRLYIALQQMRYGDKIEYVEQIEDGCPALYVVHFMLQPLIENTITHGLEQRSDRGLIIVQAYTRQDCLWLHISDNGVGITEERLLELRTLLRAEYDMPNLEHIGLKNVHDRIRLYFGDSYGLTIDSKQVDGTLITICLPIVEQDQGQLPSPQ